MTSIQLAQATDTLTGLGVAGQSAGFTTGTPLATIIGNVINVIIGLTGIIFLALLIYAGVLYLTAAGDDGKVKKAKALITQSIIGLVIIVASYAISVFVFQRLEQITTPSSSGIPTASG